MTRKTLGCVFAGWLLLLAAPACRKPVLGSGAGSDPINIDQKEGELLLPKEVPGARDHVVQVYVAQTGIQVFDGVVVAVKNGKVPGAAKRDGPDGFFLDALYGRLKQEAAKRVQAEKQGGLAFRGEAVFVMQRGIPYRLVAEVLYTMTQAGFQTFQLVVADPSGAPPGRGSPGARARPLQ